MDHQSKAEQIIRCHYSRGMFTKSAAFYDALYSWKDYPAEAHYIKEIVARNSPEARTLLDVACGTGAHLEHLGDAFELSGLDLDPELLAIARSRIPEGIFYEDDMISFDLGRRFGAVICMFSSIGYVGTVDNLNRAMRTMAAHAEHGGVVIVEPWFRPDQFEEGRSDVLVGRSGDLVIERTSFTRRLGSKSVIDFAYVVSDSSGEERDRFTEQHVLGLFTEEEYRRALSHAGLDAREVDDDGPTGRGLFVGARP